MPEAPLVGTKRTMSLGRMVDFFEDYESEPDNVPTKKMIYAVQHKRMKKDHMRTEWRLKTDESMLRPVFRSIWQKTVVSTYPVMPEDLASC